MKLTPSQRKRLKEIAKQAVPLYQGTNWEWSDKQGEPYIPSTIDIEETLIGLWPTLTQSNSISSGGLTLRCVGNGIEVSWDWQMSYKWQVPLKGEHD